MMSFLGGSLVLCPELGAALDSLDEGDTRVLRGRCVMRCDRVMLTVCLRRDS